jgi:LysR family transcriptional regulator, transcriptional activator of the cysJI operon
MDHWYSFAKIVEFSSLNKASRILNISQPALSRQIKRLEEDLGVKLFTRRGKRLVLTRAGELCYEHALELEAMNKRLVRSLDPYRGDNQSVTLTIGASLTTLQSTLPELLAAYLEAHPATDIKALTGKTHEIVSLVKEKKIDIGVIASSSEGTGYICEPLFDDHLCLILPIDHAYVDKPDVKLDDLDGQSFILFSRGTWYRILTDELFQRHGIHPDVKMEIDSFEAIIRLVSSCKAVALLPQSYVHAHLAENNKIIVRNLPELHETKRTTSLIFPKGGLDNETVHSFIEKARHYFHSRPIT